jgi:NDP-sugar pyrophosphorylase family protein
MLRTAFVLGAGLGTRLRSLTARRPKPLIPVCNRALITYAFDHLLAHGVGRFVVNTHWLPEVYEQEFAEKVYRRAPISFRHEPDILETAGGIKNVEDLLGPETFIVYNGDILTDLPLAPAIRQHAASGHEVTLVLRSQDGPLQIALDEETGRIVDIGGRLHPEREPLHLFTGIYLVNPSFLRRIPPQEKIGVVPIFLEMIRTGIPLGGIVIDDGRWWDLGTREQYLSVHGHFAESGRRGPAPWIDPSAILSADHQATGATAIGAGARIGAGAHLKNTIIWPGAEIAAGSNLVNCIVTGRAPVRGAHTDADL